VQGGARLESAVGALVLTWSPIASQVRDMGHACPDRLVGRDKKPWAARMELPPTRKGARSGTASGWLARSGSAGTPGLWTCHSHDDYFLRSTLT
jgi:hypothetical protein